MMPSPIANSIIITGPGAALMDLLCTPALARSMLRDGERTWQTALDRVARAAEPPDDFCMRAYPAAWTDEARMTRWRDACWRACIAHDALLRDRERLARAVALTAEVEQTERQWAAAAE